MSVTSAVSADAAGLAATLTADTRSVASDDTEGDFSPKGVFGRAASGLEAHVLEFARDVLLCSSRTVTGGDPFFASELVWIRSILLHAGMCCLNNRLNPCRCFGTLALCSCLLSAMRCELNNCSDVTTCLWI